MHQPEQIDEGIVENRDAETESNGKADVPRGYSLPGLGMLERVPGVIRVEPPGPIEHLLLRAVLGCVVGVEIVKDIARCLTLDEHPLLGSYLHSSADSVLNVGKTIAERDSTTLIPMLRLQLECLICGRWILSPDPCTRHVRELRLLLKSAQEAQRSEDSYVAQAGREMAADAERQARDFGVQHLSPAPSIRKMAEEIGEPFLYEEFRTLSAGAHAGFGVLAELYRTSEASAGTRVYKAILALENLARLFSALSILCWPEQREVFESILHTFRPEYVDRLRDAFSSHVIATAHMTNGDQLSAALKQEGLQCLNFWRLEISKRQSNSPDRATWPEGMPLVGAADAVRGSWSFSLSVRFRNHGPGFSAMEACTAFRTWHDKTKQQTQLKPTQGKCLHYYFYFIDELFGLCSGSLAPLSCQSPGPSTTLLLSGA